MPGQTVIAYGVLLALAIAFQSQVSAAARRYGNAGRRMALGADVFRASVLLMILFVLVTHGPTIGAAIEKLAADLRQPPQGDPQPRSR
jgi:hypothetical protein